MRLVTPDLVGRPGAAPQDDLGPEPPVPFCTPSRHPTASSTQGRAGQERAPQAAAVGRRALNRETASAAAPAGGSRPIPGALVWIGCPASWVADCSRAAEPRREDSSVSLQATKALDIHFSP